MTGLRRDPKDHQFAAAPFLIAWVFQREGKTPSAFAWRVEDGDAQKIQVCSQTPSGRLLGKVLGLVFYTIKHLYGRYDQSCFIFTLVGYKQKKILNCGLGL